MPSTSSFRKTGPGGRTRRVSGRIVDNKGQTIIGAAVVVKGTTVGTNTDVDGRYSLQIPRLPMPY